MRRKVTICIDLTLEDPPLDVYDFYTHEADAAIRKYVKAFANDIADAVEDIDCHFEVDKIKTKVEGDT